MNKAPPFHTTAGRSACLIGQIFMLDTRKGFVSAPGIKAGTVSLLGPCINHRTMKSINRQSEYEQNKYLVQAFPTIPFPKR